MNLIKSPEKRAVVSPAEARVVRDELMRLRDEWIPMKGPGGWLGVPSHKGLWAKQERAAKVAHYNGLLRQHFGWFYERTFAALEPVLWGLAKGPVVPQSDLPLPGFHVLQAGDEPWADMRGELAGPHFDSGFENIEWSPPLERIKLGQVVSFTLPVALPKDGGGLLVWDGVLSTHVADYREAHGTSVGAAITGVIEGKQPRLHAYEVGALFAHSGHVIHEVAPWNAVPGDERITLQGHALFHDAKWTVYW